MAKLKTAEIIFLIFFALAFFFWCLPGGSPTLEHSLLVVIIGSLIGLYTAIMKVHGGVRGLKSKFEMIWEDFKRRKKM